MLSQRRIGSIALITPLWFLAVYLIMSTMRPDYSHSTDAISELGSLDAPNLWAWNIFGYILPGVAIALLGAGLRREFAALGRTALIPSVALMAAGLLMALSGAFPANMADFESITTRLHRTGSFGCYFAFLIAGFWFPSLFRKNKSWHWSARPSLILVWATIAIGLLRFFEGMGGLGQRLTFLCFFLWIALIGFALLQANRHATAA